MDGVLDKHPPSTLPLLILVVSLNFDSPHEDLFEAIEDPGSKDVAFVVLIYLLIETMHIPQDFYSRWAHSLIQTIVDLFDKISSSLEEIYEASQILLDGQGVRLEPLLSLGLVTHLPDISFNGPDYFRLLAQLIHNLNAKIQKQEFTDILFILNCQVRE
jgi:hypothetical protein